MKKKYKGLKFCCFVFVVVLFCNSCDEHRTKPNIVEYVGTWVVYDSIRSKYDTAQIVKYNDSTYSYLHSGDNPSYLKLSKEGNLIDSFDSLFIIRYYNKTDQLIMKNILIGEDLYINRLK